ncbi:hypothetical protein BJ742DRAFT_471518 [Cladochytrium replicatum]|nr:hypothetical protein BJ742DRAFT_471518 [Cladochytrium replicatum]
MVHRSRAGLDLILQKRVVTCIHIDSDNAVTCTSISTIKRSLAFPLAWNTTLHRLIEETPIGAEWILCFGSFRALVFSFYVTVQVADRINLFLFLLFLFFFLFLLMCRLLPSMAIAWRYWYAP